MVTSSPRRKSDKVMRDAISVALHRTEQVDGEARKRIYLVADKLVALAVAGDMAAIKEVNDRIDGKAVQALVGDPDNPVAIAVIERRIK